MRIELDNAITDIVNNTVLKELKKDKNVIIFGAGASGDWAADLLRSHGIFPKCYCDNSSRKWGKMRNGLKIQPFTEAIKEYEGAAICIASMWQEEIYKQICEYDNSLAARTYNLLTTMAWETSGKQYRSEELDYIQCHLDAFENLCGELADETSRMTLEGLLNYRLTRDTKWLKRIKSEEEIYLDKEILKGEYSEYAKDGIIIDGGGYNGDTVDLIIGSCKKNNVLNIHCYECEEENCRVIEEKIHKDVWHPHHVVLHKAALWNEKTKIRFEGNGLSGNVNSSQTNNGEGKWISAERIDDYPYEKVSLIKLDVEGAERQVLAGAAETIKRDRPVLAICAYHLQDDLLVLSDFIRSLDCSYQLYLRHYMLASGDSILYGVPV